MNNRILAMLLAIIMIVSIVPVNAFAAENGHADGCLYKAPCTCESINIHTLKARFGECTGYPCTKNCANNNGGTVTPAEHTCADKDFNHLCDTVGCGKVVHAMTKVEAVAPNHEFGGNIEYWVCGTCTNYFEDEAGTKKIEDKNSVNLNKVAHTMVWTVTETTHKYDCTGCGYDEIKETAHIFGSPVSNGNGTHTKTCTVEGCGYSVTEDCADTSDCKCDGCQADMGHSYDWDFGATSHRQMCQKNNTHVTAYEPHKLSGVSTGNFTHKETCEVCGYAGEAIACKSQDGDCYCDVCGGIAPHDTNAMTKLSKWPDCTETGWYEHFWCETCDLRLRNGEVTTRDEMFRDALGHAETEWEHYEDKHVEICTRCNEAVSESAHQYEFVGNGDGTHRETCATCGRDDVDSVCVDENADCVCDECKEVLPHDVNEMERFWQAQSCSQIGYKLHFKCKNAACGRLFEYEGAVGSALVETTLSKVTIQKDPHTEGWVKDNDTHKKVCTVCDEVLLDTDSHSFTYTDRNDDKGHNAACSVCDYVQARPHVDADKNCVCDDCTVALGHNLKDVAKVDAKCGADGMEAHKECTVCGGLFDTKFNPTTADDLKLDALQHKWWPKGMDVDGTVHTEQCEYCKVIRILGHFDNTGDCMCDYEGCVKPAHEHTIMHAPEVAATCVKTGRQEYWYFKECGKKFNDAECTQPLTEMIVYGTTDHTWGSWTGCADGVNHERVCSVCREKETASHDFSGEAPYCKVCNTPEGLEFQEEVPATCNRYGTMAHWKSSITERRYWDAAGTQYISDLYKLQIPKLIHNMVIDSSDGVTHIIKCSHDCGLEYEEDCFTEDGDCVCDVCMAPMDGHVLTFVEGKPATCTKNGLIPAWYCAECDQYYDLDTVEPIRTNVAPAYGHSWRNSWYNDTNEGMHSRYCMNPNCGEKQLEAHDMEAVDVLKGNLHSLECTKCNFADTEIHYDEDGDAHCDECGHDFNKVIEESYLDNDRVTITIENDDDDEDDDEKKSSSVWNSFMEKLKPSYVGESNNAPSSNVGSGSGSGSGSSTGGNVPGSSSSSIGIFDAVVQVLVNLWNALFGN